jgi:hypothetical protein
MMCWVDCNVVGNAPRGNHIAVQIDTPNVSDSRIAASFRLTASYFLRSQKVTKKLAPNPASPSGARNGRDQNKSPDRALTARSGLMVLVYDRPLLRSSARGDGAFTSNSDRFAIGLRKSGCEHPGYVARKARSNNDGIIENDSMPAREPI